MKIFIQFFICLGLLLSCQNKEKLNPYEHKTLKEWMENNHKIKVLSTTGMINDLVKEIGGDYVDTFVLINGELDPHSYQLVKGDDEKFFFAQLIFYNGLGLEHGPSLNKYLHNNPKAVAIGDEIINQKPDLAVYVNGQIDPHIWSDIFIWSQGIPFILEKLINIDPIHAKEFQINAFSLKEKMIAAHQKIQRDLQAIPQEKRYLVTSHDAFNYFTRAYLAERDEVANGEWVKRCAAPEGLSPESQLSSHDIQNIIDHLKKYHIHVLFPESNVNKDSIEKIIKAGKEWGLTIEMSEDPLYGDAMGSRGSNADTYLKMIEFNAKTIKKHLN